MLNVIFTLPDSHKDVGWVLMAMLFVIVLLDIEAIGVKSAILDTLVIHWYPAIRVNQ